MSPPILAHLRCLRPRPEVQVVHRDEDAPLRRLEPVTDIGQRPVHDGAHGVGEVAVLQLLLDLQVFDAPPSGEPAALASVGGGSFCHESQRVNPAANTGKSAPRPGGLLYAKWGGKSNERTGRLTAERSAGELRSRSRFYCPIHQIQRHAGAGQVSNEANECEHLCYSCLPRPQSSGAQSEIYCWQLILPLLKLPFLRLEHRNEESPRSGAFPFSDQTKPRQRKSPINVFAQYPICPNRATFRRPHRPCIRSA